ncbi:MAG: single-stranded-DNA-specific exonuclease RecJ [Deferribacterota bacterium]|nr:single-stranded-DNA-specific exonuclease RecJ [Deferribacterota bacterium]
MEHIDSIKRLEKGYKYYWYYNEVDITPLLSIGYKLRIPLKILEILIKRGIKNKEDLVIFIESPLNKFLNPFDLKGVDKAVEKIYNALKEKQKICIYGDYDVDGITATSVLYLFLKEVGANVTYYIPNSLREGYSLNKNAIKILAKQNVDLLITVDCGINSYEEILIANSVGIDVIVTDHHKPNEHMSYSNITIINPYRYDETYPFKGLSGVGVIFKIILALQYFLDKKGYFNKNIKRPKLINYLDLVSLGTIGDVSPLVSENRIIVKHGLQLLSNNFARTGIQELKKAIGLYHNNINVSHVSYMINPRINAAARAGDSDYSVRLLTTKNINEAKKLVTHLNEANKKRQYTEKQTLNDSLKKIDKYNLLEKDSALILYSHNWDPAIIGVIASKILEYFNRPTVVVAFNNNIGKGSARSSKSFNLYKSIESLSKFLYEYGGHRNAVGLKIDYKYIKEFGVAFNDYVEKNLTGKYATSEITIDAIIEPDDLTGEFIEWLEKLEPYGEGNPKPILLMKDVNFIPPVKFTGKNNDTLRGFIEKNNKVIEVVGYKMNNAKKEIKNLKNLDIIFTIERTQWANDEILIKLIDIKKAH